MSTAFIPVSDVPDEVYQNTGRTVSLLTVYNWVNKGYRGRCLGTRPIQRKATKGRSVVTGVRLDVLNKFLNHRYQEVA